MAVVHHQQRNSMNLQKHIQDMLGRGANGLPIAYKQANQLVLLGEGHDQADVDRINNAVGDWKYEGRIAVHVNQKEQVLTMHIIPNTPQRSERYQLEEAVRQAVQGMTIESNRWPVQFKWPD